MRTILCGVSVACFLLPAAFAAQPPQRIDNRGYLYGTVETRSDNSYTGFIRWGREEAFWDDLFNAGKEELPYEDARPSGERDRREVKVFGVRISYGYDSTDRQFVARFGDLREVEPYRGGVRVTLRNGETFELDDSSNDVGATLRVEDAALGEVKIDWDKIERVRFAQAPVDAKPKAWRLLGRLETRSTTFEGPIQWDLEECLSTDELDGETRDGDLAIPMGSIRSIERNNSRGAWVELEDGRRLLLEGTNDVDSSTSGIFVEDARFGRVKVPWDEFVRVDFASDGSSGRGYDEYPDIRHLTGRVVERGGGTRAGRLVFDLDEEWSWEFLDGELGGVEYAIPFYQVKSIRPGRDSSRIVLSSGQELELSDTQDVSEENDGIVVLGGGEEGQRYIAWRDVVSIELD